MRNLETEVTTGLVLHDPFMIASSHWTSSEQSFRQLAGVSPSAVTLKTTSQLYGGDGQAIGSREKRILKNPAGVKLAYYTDGPKPLELWDITTTYKLTGAAKRILPATTILGLSVLYGEDYSSINQSLAMENYGYVELNWKYTFREADEEDLQDITADVENFLKVFKGIPRIIKLPREATQFLKTSGFQKLLSLLVNEEVPLIVANSQRLRIPPSRVSGTDRKELVGGVVVGEHLYLDTYNLFRSLAELKNEATKDLCLIGSGGIVDIGGFVDLTAVGAKAVQLCTALDDRGIQVLPLLREQLNALGGPTQTFMQFFADIHATSDECSTEWKRASAKACDLDQFGDHIIREVLANQDRLVQLIEAALIVECAGEHLEAKKHLVSDLDRRYRFVITRSNVSTYLLGHRCAANLNLETLYLDDTAEFRKELVRPGFDYDFAILPRSVFDEYQRQRTTLLKQKKPIAIKRVASSTFELVGYELPSLDGLKELYHFGGATSRHAFSELLKVTHPDDPQELSTTDLLPLFRFWHPTSTILAKPPLSRLYPLLGHKDMQDKWTVLWQTSEDLLLIASEKTLATPEGKLTADIVLSELEHIRGNVLNDPRKAALECISGGFSTYFAKLLGDKTRAF